MDNTIITGNIRRVWAMPNHHTFLIKPIAELVARYVGDGKNWVDPFAGDNSPADENDWIIGAPSFSRKEVFNLLYTQRAMIKNDFKTHFGDVMVEEMYSLLNNPRIPKF